MSAWVVEDVSENTVCVSIYKNCPRVIGVQPLDQRSQPHIEETNHLIYLIDASVSWGQTRGPLVRNAS